MQKMLKNLSEKPSAQFPATTYGYSMAKIACLDDAFSEVFEQKASPVEGQSLLQKDKNRQKRRAKTSQKQKKDVRSLSQNFDFCTCLSKNVVKHDASGKKGMLSHCKLYLY